MIKVTQKWHTLAMKQSVPIVIFQILLAISSTNPFIAPTQLLITRIGPCYDHQELKVTTSEMSLTRDASDSTLSGHLNISQNIESGWTVKAVMQKCHDIRNLDTCDFFKTFAIVTSGCNEPNNEDLYIKFFDYVEPKLVCPLQAGTYAIKDFPFFAEDTDTKIAQSKIWTSVFGYTYQLQGFDKNNEKILCMEAFLQLMYIREHKWQTKKEVGNISSSSSHDYNNDDAQNISEEE